ncbi:MAG TPA: universal stress protein [Ramlibacter sp.]|nr:universal stress protein [Ramlibacter sp.]
MFQRILVPVDGSGTANQALATAIDLASSFKARLRLIHVVDETAYLSGYDPFGGYAGDLLRVMRESGQKILDEGTASARAAGVDVDNMLFDQLGERLGESVAQAAKLWNADVIVVGTHGRRGLGRVLMGSGAEQIIRLAPVPVLVIRGGDDDGR